jgi:hypothetical protein
MTSTNLFFHRGPVHKPEYFFGRRQETASLFELLRREQSVSISGQRRLGKTSLLFYAAAPEIAAGHGLEPGQVRWVYIDGGMLDDLDEESVYGAIDRGLQEGTVEHIPYEELVAHIRTMAAKNLRLVVMLDEFEVFASNARLQPRLFNRLRGLTAQFPVQFVIASKEPLARLSFANPEVMSSWFFNIFVPLRLGLFSRDEAVEMMSELSRKGGSVFRADAMDFLLELAGPHPHFLQVACYHAFALQRRGALSASDRQAVKERTQEELEGHLDYYWRNLSAEEQYTLAALPLAIFEGHAATTAELAEAGLLFENQYLGEALRDFVARQSVPGLLRHGAFVMDERRRLLTVGGELVHLTPTEFAALRLLLQEPGCLLTPEDIEARLWPEEIAPDPERARGLMKKLRVALGEAGEAIVTQRGQGYRLG